MGFWGFGGRPGRQRPPPAHHRQRNGPGCHQPDQRVVAGLQQEDLDCPAAPHDLGCQQILPIEWDAIAQRKMKANDQLLPGDRLFLAEDEMVTFSNVLNKVTRSRSSASPASWDWATPRSVATRRWAARISYPEWTIAVYGLHDSRLIFPPSACLPRNYLVY